MPPDSTEFRTFVPDEAQTLSAALERSEVDSGPHIILECQDLSYAYQNSKLVLKDINIVTHRDELVAVVGPTGTGKSTLLRCLAYLLPQTGGQVLLDGRQVRAPSSRISLIHESIATFPWMTALDDVKLALRGHGLLLPVIQAVAAFSSPSVLPPDLHRDDPFP